jgi:hypothetical protein
MVQHMVYQEDEISFVKAQNCCVCFVDVVDSIRVTSSINNPEKVSGNSGN